MQGCRDAGMTVQLNASTNQLLFGNQFVNSYYIDDNLLKERSEYVLKNLRVNAPVNHDFHPVMYRQQLSVWLNQHGLGWPVVLGVVAGVLLLVLLLLNRTGAGLFAAGFTGVSLEVTVMLALQVALGYIFSIAGIVIMLFMAGLALGPWLVRRFFPLPEKRHYILLLCLMALMPLLTLLLTVHSSLFTAIVLILAASLVLGMLYPVSVAISPSDALRSASRNYAADLFGSAIGAFLVPVVFLPVMGLVPTLILLTLLCTVAIGVSLVK